MPRPLRSLRLRQVLVTRLRADDDFSSLGSPPLSDGDRIYGKRQPATLTWPFVRVSTADEGPIRKGTTVRFTIHTFSKADYDDECEALNAGVQVNLEDAVLQLSPSTKAFVTWVGSQVIP